MGWRGNIHNPVPMHLPPHRIMRLRYLLKHPIFVNSTSHPTLHSVTMLMRECEANPGMMWARRAGVGRLGKSSMHVCVDCTRSPLGKHAMMGLMARWMLLSEALVMRKLLVAPESKMAQLLMESMLMLTEKSGSGKGIWLGGVWARR
jgi:hypothetical protein